LTKLGLIFFYHLNTSFEVISSVDVQEPGF